MMGSSQPREILELSRLIATKAEFQELAEQRLAEAKALLDQGQWDGAYYLAGYAVELGPQGVHHQGPARDGCVPG